MNNAHKCPRCNQFILGTYCCACKEDIQNMWDESIRNNSSLDDIFEPFGNMFGNIFKKDKK